MDKKPDPGLEHLTEQEITDLMALTAFTGDKTDLEFAKRCRDEILRRWQLPRDPKGRPPEDQ
jgi:hypothetical protein